MKLFIYSIFKLVTDFVFKIPFAHIRLFYIKIFMKVGNKSFIGINVDIRIHYNITIGNNSIINRNCVLDGRGAKLIIGNNVDIAQETNIWTCQHMIDDENYAPVSKDVIIEDYVWITSRVTVLPGVRIGKGAVVASGAVVTKDVPECTVVAGVPAKKIGIRNCSLSYKLPNPFFLQWIHDLTNS